MYYFYVLESISKDYLYYGSTSDLSKRLLYHNEKKVKSTKYNAPYKILYFEKYNTLSEARKREFNIKKNWAAKADLKKKIFGSTTA
ncbi:hypothetical protein COT78_02155 [Candidatus Berkelbacteria bacterium CG10_big_fil_rev_8_21_14_0_10_43_13]|uniref:GIY-YIG domain-containing protein n=1 Tax=Candidatus Berkelbacteria bacterium CG10_big_fil_rev_8_21_14_0_10_43_13 TaxID=1974514 RepID=A0A2H0W8Q4_9BACT|nr:MAG: hypothetical protein COT78_02155 [Candidatus Berkelbacteria bacterium CG10_big_fil_rev_8_21_14_0_10_43_13]